MNFKEIKPGDRVICKISSNVIGTIENVYTLTDSKPQSRVRTDDGKLYCTHNTEWVRIGGAL